MTRRAASLREAFDAAFAVAPTPAPEREDILAIRVGGDPYALRLAEVASLQRMRKITRAASGDAWFLGLAGIRGIVAPVYDLAALLGYGAASTTTWLALARAPSILAFGFDEVEAHVRISVASRSTGVDASKPHLQGVVRIDGTTRPVVHLASLVEALVKRRRAQAPPKEP